MFISAGSEGPEVRQPPADDQGETGRRRGVRLFHGEQRVLHPGLRRLQRGGGPVQAALEPRGEDVVVDGRDREGDPVVDDDLDAFDEVLLLQSADDRRGRGVGRLRSDHVLEDAVESAGRERPQAGGGHPLEHAAASQARPHAGLTLVFAGHGVVRARRHFFHWWSAARRT